MPNGPPVFNSPPETVVGTQGEQLFIQFTGQDPEGQTLAFSQTGAPSWLSITTSGGDINFSGTPPPGATGPYTITVTATELSAPNQSTSHTFELYIETFAESPLKGDLIITEIRFAETALNGQFLDWNQYDEFVEFQNVSDSPIDVSNFYLSEHNFRTQNGEGGVTDPHQHGSFDRSSPPRPAILQPGERAVLWIINPNQWGGTIDSGAALNFVANDNSAFSVFESNGDDIWLIDDQERVVDYVAWGSQAMSSSVIDPAADSHALWDTTDDGHLLNAQPGQSISLAIPLTTGPGNVLDPTGYTNPRCWEITGSGTASCPQATPPTDSTDGNGDVSSAGEANV